MPLSRTRITVPSSRSVTRAEPSGRKARPQGTCSLLATVTGVDGRAVAGEWAADRDADDGAGGVLADDVGVLVRGALAGPLVMEPARSDALAGVAAPLPVEQAPSGIREAAASRAR